MGIEDSPIRLVGCRQCYAGADRKKECSGQGTRRTGRIDKGNQASPCSVAMAWDGPDRFFVCCHGPGWFPAGGLALCTSAAGLAQICARTEQEEAAG